MTIKTTDTIMKTPKKGFLRYLFGLAAPGVIAGGAVYLGAPQEIYAISSVLVVGWAWGGVATAASVAAGEDPSSGLTPGRVMAGTLIGAAISIISMGAGANAYSEKPVVPNQQDSAVERQLYPPVLRQ